MSHPRQPFPAARRRVAASLDGRPWPNVRWEYSLLLPLALILIVATLVFADGRKDVIAYTVMSSVTGEPVAGATVSVGEVSYRTGEDGTITIERPEPGTPIIAAIDGYQSVRAETREGSAPEQVLQVTPSVVRGEVLDAATGDAIEGVQVAILDASGTVVHESRTDAAGSYMFKNLPADPLLRVDGGAYGVVEEAVDDREVVNLRLELKQVSGSILDDAGEPVRGALVQAGETRVVTGADGLFSLDGVSPGAEIRVTAAGFKPHTQVAESGTLEGLRLEPQIIRGVYANWSLLATPGGLDSLIEIANTTEINAIVIDIKQDTIYYDSQVQFFHDAGVVAPIYDVHDVIARLEENNIYPIARLVVFQDPLVAEAMPHLAVHDTGGDLWRNEMGVAWVSAFNEELWDANIALAEEAVGLGFREIQYDYVRFPSDGDLSTADFGREYTAQAREDAITEFMRRSYESVHAAGGLLAADLFGFITIVDDEQYIGQRFSRLEPYIDYVNMMIYPSHFSEGNIASAPGHPNDYPYETIYESLERAAQIVPGSEKKFRPWLQDFSYWNLRPYDASDVRAQIDAAEDFGATGWMLWGDPHNVTVDALKPGDGND